MRAFRFLLVGHHDVMNQTVILSEVTHHFIVIILNNTMGGV